MKCVILLLLILPNVLCHVIGGRYNEDYDVYKRRQVVIYKKSESTNVSAQHFTNRLEMDTHHLNKCKALFEYRSCKCQEVPHGIHKSILDTTTGIIENFQPIMCKGDEKFKNNTTPPNTYYVCKTNHTEYQVLRPGDSEYHIESLGSECYCEAKSFPEECL